MESWPAGARSFARSLVNRTGTVSKEELGKLSVHILTDTKRDGEAGAVRLGCSLDRGAYRLQDGRLCRSH